MRRAIRSPHRTQVDHLAAAERARTVPGKWVLVGQYAAMQTAQTAVLRIPRAERIPSYEPAGSFEAYAANTPDGPVVWVRCVEGGPYPELPDRMLVRVPVPGEGPGDVTVTPVSITARCRTCGGPRGWDRVRPCLMRIGTQDYEVDRWSNPCGHADVLADVYAEARQAPRPGLGALTGQRPGGGHRPNPIRAGVFRRAVELVLQAADEDPGLHAKPAVALLRLHGHQEAARLVEDRLQEDGSLTARQAAQLLTTEGAALRTSPSTSRQEATA